MSNPWHVVHNSQETALKDIMTQQRCDSKATQLGNEVHDVHSVLDVKLEGVESNASAASTEVDQLEDYLYDNEESLLFPVTSNYDWESYSLDLVPSKCYAGTSRAKRDKLAKMKEKVQQTLSTYDLLVLLHERVITKLLGKRRLGDEAVLYYSPRHPDYVQWSKYTEHELPKMFTVKIINHYSKDSNRERNLRNDIRFKDRMISKDPKEIANMWAEKEEMNLKLLEMGNVSWCYKVYERKKNILVLSTIGDHKSVIPTLANADLTRDQLHTAYWEVAGMMYVLFHNGLVHGNISEHNILYYKEKCWLADVAYAMPHKSPGSLNCLMQDCVNTAKYFSSRGTDIYYDKDDLFFHCSGLDIYNNSLKKLEVLHELKIYE